MPIGSEAELRGRGKILGDLEATFCAGAGYMGLIKAGVAASLAGNTSISGEYSLCVTSLGADKVRVKITKINENETALSCNMRAGIISLIAPGGISNGNALKIL